MQNMRNLQGQFVGVHFLTDFLKPLRDSICLNSEGKRSQIFGPKNDILSLP